MNQVAFITALIFGMMIVETRISRRNERALRLGGALEPSGDVYRAMAFLYPAAFFLMGLEGAWRGATADRGSLTEPSWQASGVGLFIASKALKYWAIRSLGDRWSFRVLVVPGRPLVTSGPYRYVAHPNYIAVVGELASAAMMVGARVAGPVMLALFSVVLWKRVQLESRALGGRVSFPQNGAKRGQGS
jgi:methyltransferase